MLELSLPKNEHIHLYGRDREKNLLFGAVQRRLLQGSQPEFILLSGPSGTGKTVLAKTLEQPVTSEGGYFIMGKFNQVQRPEPYAAFAAAFTQFINLLKAKGNTAVREVRESIIQAVGSDSSLLKAMFPVLEDILGPKELSACTALSLSNSFEANNRLKVIFRDFVFAICSLAKPILLIMDDLQWIDAGSLDLLEALISDNQNHGLIVIGICRSNEISFDHSFASMLRRLEDNNSNPNKRRTVITHITVSNLTHADTSALVSDELQLAEELCAPCSDVVYNKTKGNPFFVVQFLTLLCIEDRGLLQNLNQGCWKFRLPDSKNDCGIMSLGLTSHMTDDIVNLISLKIERLHIDVRNSLTTAAFMNGIFDECLIATIFPDINVGEALANAIDEGMLVEDLYTCRYTFSHDTIQQAAYSFVPKSEQASTHLFIGRRLWNSLPLEKLTANIFIVVDQMRRCVPLLQDQEEKDTLAALCLRAGEKAAMSGDFKKASMYFWFGIDLLGSSKWENQYEIGLELYNAVIETEYCLGHFDKMDMALEEVLSNARTFSDKIQAYLTQVCALGARNYHQEAIDLGVYVLDRLGESFPVKLKPSILILDMAKTHLFLHGMTDARILQLPDINDGTKVAAMSMINMLSAYCFNARPELFPLIATRYVRLSLKYGLCANSAQGFAMYGIVCCAMGSFQAGYRYGQLAHEILERYKLSGIPWVPRVYTLFYGMISCWSDPLRPTLEHLLYAHKVAMKTGDIEFALRSGVVYCGNGFCAGVKLKQIEEKQRIFLQLARRYKQSQCDTALSLQLQAILNMMGRSDGDPSILTGEISDHEEQMKAAISHHDECHLAFIMFWRLIVVFHLRRYDLALEMAEKSRVFEKLARSCFVLCVQNFYDGMTAFALAREAHNTSAGRRAKKHHLKSARRAMAKIRKYARICPQNCSHKLYLMQAEMLAINGKIDLALTKYDNSITLARNEGFIHEEALANECAAIAIQAAYPAPSDEDKSAVNASSKARQYLKKSLTLYREWGATVKVEQIKSDLYWW